MGTDVRINVKLFAFAKVVVGNDQVELELQEGATVGDVRAALGAAYPDLQALIPQMLIAVDSQYSEENQVVTSTSEIACIPPVSGGGKAIDSPRRLP